MNIKKAEVYVRAANAAALDEKETRALIEDEFSYKVRSFTLSRGKWDDFR